MKTISLVGKSGTGKSFQAIGLCAKLGVNYLIDDGLFIGNGAALAGKSAKRQATKVSAIKTALFTDEAHRNEVARKIAETNPPSILIVGTSDRMVEKITERLGLPKPSEQIDVESVTTEDERRIAAYRRHELGQHVIPAPTLAIKRDFSGYFLHPLKVLRDIREGRETETERSVVRPTFSYFGNFSISNKALLDIVEATAALSPAVAGVESVFVRKRKEGIRIETRLIFRAGFSLLDAARRFQEAAWENIDEMTSMNIIALDLSAAGLSWSEA